MTKYQPKIFISYSRRDKSSLEELRKHLLALERGEGVQIFYDGQIMPGEQWDKRILHELQSADIIILLISADFLASDYIYEVEFKKALERHQNGESRVIPVILRSCDWKSTAIAKLQAVPSDGKPISNLKNEDEGFYQVAVAIKYAIEDLKAKIVSQDNFNENQNKQLPAIDVNDAFPKSGVPIINFVEPVSFNQLMMSIKHKGRGLIIEGPSGIGKTTAINKAIERIAFQNNPYTYLSARDPKNIEKISTIEVWHKGIVVIDDFHRLGNQEKKRLSDYIKYLADVETSTRKLIIVGIPNTGKKLISFGHDLATRVDIFEFSRVENEKINELITKGEDALNIKFDKKSDLILAANGSLSIAQFLCNHAAVQDDVFETQAFQKIVTTKIADVILSVRKEVGRRFDNFIFCFSQLGGNKDRTCIKLLKEMALSENGSVNLNRLCNSKPELAHGIEKILENGAIESLIENQDVCNDFIFYDNRTSELVIDDPQLIFYINNTAESTIANFSGKREILKRNKVFISYSHVDEPFLDRLLVHLKPLITDGDIDIWSDKRIKPGDQWNKEIISALEGTKVAILLVSADFIASSYITQVELPHLIKATSEEGAMIIPIFLKPSNLNRFENINKYQGINSPNETLIDLPEPEREKIFVKVSQRVEEIYSSYK